MLELEAALARILEEIPSPQLEDIALPEAAGRYSGEQVEASIDLPGFDNSSMDGYAVRSSDLARASESSPVPLRVTGKLAAGDKPQGHVATGTCIRLFTGSPLPDGADAVIMQEDTRPAADDPQSILVVDGAKPLENVRLRGEDVKKGAQVLAKGELLTSGRLCLLAAMGLKAVRVGRKPVVGLLATGSELREAGESLGPGQIYESNRAGIAALVKQAGGVPRIFPLVADTLDATKAALETALAECDILVTSGGVSVGEMDFVKAAFEGTGGTLQFWRVAIKPGRPFVYGRHGNRFLFGLPGNPVSAVVTFLLLARPAIIRWQGGTDVALPSHPAILEEPISNPGNRRHFVRVRIDGSGHAVPSGAQSSHMLSSLAAANGLLDMPPATVFEAGRTVQVMRVDW